MDASGVFAKHFATCKFEDLPKEVVEATKIQILDYFGVAMCGSTKVGANEVRALTLEMGGAEQATVFGPGVKVPVTNAAQCNATSAHTLDFDDVHEQAVMHPGVVSIPTSLAVGEFVGKLSGKDFITAVALGGDMICRMGLATRPGENIHKYGWHFTTLNGYMTAAAIASRIMGMPEDKIVSAIGIAYHQSSGNGQAVKDGVMTKRLGPGFAVRGGIYAARLADMGVTGAINTFEGVSGSYKVYHGNCYSRDILVGDLGKRWESTNISVKPYSCCRGVHPAIDCALKLSKEHNVTPDNIEKVIIAVGEGPTYLLCEPIEAKKNPRNLVDSQFSIPWGVSTALAYGKVSLNNFTEEAIHDQNILNVSNKIEMELDKSLNSTGLEPARVTVITKDGRTEVEYTETATGSPDCPLSFDQCAAKFYDLRECADKPLSKENADKIVELVRNLENLEDVSEIIKLLVWA